MEDDRYAVLQSSRKKTWIEGSPLVCLGMDLLYDRQQNATALRAEFENAADRPIQELTIQILSTDAVVQELRYSNLNVKPGERFGSSVLQPIQGPLTEQAEVIPQAVVFEDQTAWQNLGGQKPEELPVQRRMAEVLGPELEGEYLRQSGTAYQEIPLYPIDRGSFWLCSCGSFNTTDTCHRCGRNRRQVMATARRGYLEQTAGSAAAEPLPAEPASVPQKKKKKWPWILGGSAALLAGLMALAIFVLVPFIQEKIMVGSYTGAGFSSWYISDYDATYESYHRHTCSISSELEKDSLLLLDIGGHALLAPVVSGRGQIRIPADPAPPEAREVAFAPVTPVEEAEVEVTAKLTDIQNETYESLGVKSYDLKGEITVSDSTKPYFVIYTITDQSYGSIVWYGSSLVIDGKGNFDTDFDISLQSPEPEYTITVTDVAEAREDLDVSFGAIEEKDDWVYSTVSHIELEADSDDTGIAVIQYTAYAADGTVIENDGIQSVQIVNGHGLMRLYTEVDSSMVERVESTVLGYLPMYNVAGISE